MTDFVEYKVKLYKHRKTCHTLFIRQHRVREKDEGKPTDRTLFVASIPPFFNKNIIEALFTNFGKVVATHIHKTPSPKVPANEDSKFFEKLPKIEGYRVAYVVYQKSCSVEVALANTAVGVVAKDFLCSGFIKWAEEYNGNIPDPEAMQKDISEFMAQFDNNDVKKRKLEKDATEMDNEGWTTVTKKSRKAGFSRKESVLKHLHKKSEQRKKKKELTNFYRFQIKESKMKNLVSLRQKFEEDKKRIAAIKATRRFKPF